MLGSGIWGYGKGKAPERHVCVQCLCKGIECKWDKGGIGESNFFFVFPEFGVDLRDRQIVPTVPQQQNSLYCQSCRASVVKEAENRGGKYSKLVKKLRLEATTRVQVLKKPEVYLHVKSNYSF